MTPSADDDDDDDDCRVPPPTLSAAAAAAAALQAQKVSRPKKMPEKHLLLDQAQANTHTHAHMNTHKTLLFQCVSVLPEDAAGQANCSHLLHFSSALSPFLSLNLPLSFFVVQAVAFKCAAI